MPFLFQSAGHKYFEMRILKIKIKAEGWFTAETPLSHTTSVAPLHVKYTGQKQTKHHHLLVSEIFFCQRSQYFPGQTEHGSVGCIQSPRFVRRLEAAADLKQESRWDLRIVRLHSLLASPPPIDIHQLIWDLCSASLVKLSTNLHKVSRCSEKSLISDFSAFS